MRPTTFEDCTTFEDLDHVITREVNRWRIAIIFGVPLRLIGAL